MNDHLATMVEKFAANTRRVKENFFWQAPMNKRLAALFYTAAGKEADCDAIRRCHEMMKGSTGIFSMFRGNSALSIATLLSLAEDPSALFDHTLAVYDQMKEAGFWSSDYLAVAAFQIALHGRPEDASRIVSRAKDFYDGMKSSHWFLTGQDDYIFAAMLGLSDVEVERGVADIEGLYGELKPAFLLGNGVQALAQVLLLGGEAAQNVPRVLDLRKALRERGIRLDREYTLSSLGVLALLPGREREIADEVAEAAELLRRQQGFGVWSVGKQELALLSASLTAYNKVDEAQSGLLASTLSTSITNIIIAQQAAVAASSAAAAAAASSANN